MEARSRNKQEPKHPTRKFTASREGKSVSPSGIEKRKPQKVESINTTERRLIYEKEIIFGGGNTVLNQGESGSG